MTDREKAFLLHGIAQCDLRRAIYLMKKWDVPSLLVAETFHEVQTLTGAKAICPCSGSEHDQ